MKLTEERYFAATKDPAKLGQKLWGRYERLLAESHPHEQQWAAAYEHCYGVENEAGMTWAATRRGELGELAALRVNRARMLLRARLALISGQEVKFRPKAKRGDAGAAYATTLSTVLLENAWKRAGMEELFSQWLDVGESFSSSYLFTEWDRSLGPDVLNFGGRLIRAGDARVSVLPPWHVRYDRSHSCWEDVPWWFVEVYRNKYELAALYSKLLSGETGEEAEAKIVSSRADERLRAISSRESDSEVVPLVYFVHKPSLVIPNGLMVPMLSADCVLIPATGSFDLCGDSGPYEKGTVPLERYAPEPMPDTPDTWAPWWDTLAPQDILDGADTSFATTMTTMSNPVIVAHKGDEKLDLHVGNGFRVLPINTGNEFPKQMEMGALPPGALEWKQDLKDDQRQIAGLNDIALGQPDTAQMNAEAFGILYSMAQQQASPYQRRFRRAGSNALTTWLKTMRHNVRGKRLLQLVGDSEKNLLIDSDTWNAKELAPMDLVEFEEGNPLEDTATGRVALLQFYSSLGILKGYEEVQQVISTGRFEPALKGNRDELLLLRVEYEMLQRGQAPMVHRSQNDVLHYREHMCVMHSPTALRSPQVRMVTEEHAKAHYLQCWGVPMDGDQMVLMRHRFMMGLGPLPLAGMPMDPAMGDGAAQGPPDEGVGAPGQPPALAPAPGAETPAPPDGAPPADTPPLLQ